ncbi:MAG: CRISPR-associated ring nuclease [Ktedonobacteraceae bacterium]
MEHVLVATLGDSPIVVTSMYDKLMEMENKKDKQQQQPIDRVIVIHPRGIYRNTGYLVIEEALQELCEVESRELNCADTYTEEDCFHFLRTLFDIFKEHQHDTISLSLAGGRKNMSAIMALVAPFYPECTKGLYHILDESEYTDQRNVKSIQELEGLYNNDKARLLKAMHPLLDDLKLVPIPFENALSVTNKAYIQKLLTMTADQLQELWEKDPTEADRQQFHLTFANPDALKPLLQVHLTEQAKKEFEKLGGSRKENFKRCFKGMRFPKHLAKAWHLTARTSYPGHFYKGGGTAERPFFHTEPGDIINYPHSKVERVIVERMAKHRNDDVYEPTKKSFEQTTYNNDEKLCLLEDILDEKQPTPSILIVPMGTTPMVATQLYTLLTTREKHDIQQVILLYPGNAESVKQAARLAKGAFESKGVVCTMHPILGLADIASEADCRLYQNTLEHIIVGLQQNKVQQNPKLRIDLALSGGRKGMAAMALFAAQRTQLSEVYHTLITDKDLDQRVESEASVEKLTRMKPRDQNDILFLCAYQAQENAFQIFKVPMGPLHGK